MGSQCTWPSDHSGVISGDGRTWSAVNRWLKAVFGYGLSKRCEIVRGCSRFLPFGEAREFVRRLGLRNQTEWGAWCADHRPETIPSNPQTTYQAEWQGLGDWLGTRTVAPQDKVFWPFSKARDLAHRLGLKGQADWAAWVKSDQRPEEIPSMPSRVYCSEWQGWGDWLGTGNVHTKQFWTFTRARAFARKLRLKGQADWAAWAKSGKRPEGVPSNPNFAYESEWKGYGDWLGTGNVANTARVFFTFQKARAFVRELGLTRQEEWLTWAKSGQRPLSIPSTPGKAYPLQYRGIKDWLGT
jgi:hypothetical protein